MNEILRTLFLILMFFVPPLIIALIVWYIMHVMKFHERRARHIFWIVYLSLFMVFFFYILIFWNK
jgi:hypothetical protein